MSTIYNQLMLLIFLRLHDNNIKYEQKICEYSLEELNFLMSCFNAVALLQSEACYLKITIVR